MSGHGFHVHGPHDHAVEEVGHEGGGGGHGGKNANRLAVATAILATIGAMFGYMGGSTQNAAAMYKNEAAILKTEASNKWNYYQAKSQKQNIAELSVMLLTDEGLKDKQKEEIARYKTEKEEIKKEAEKIEEASKHKDMESEHEMHKHHRWALATTILQIAIALAAISLLTQKKWLEYGMYGTSLIGVAAGISALFI